MKYIFLEHSMWGFGLSPQALKLAGDGVGDGFRRLESIGACDQDGGVAPRGCRQLEGLKLRIQKRCRHELVRPLLNAAAQLFLVIDTMNLQ